MGWTAWRGLGGWRVTAPTDICAARMLSGRTAGDKRSLCCVRVRLSLCLQFFLQISFRRLCGSNIVIVNHFFRFVVRCGPPQVLMRGHGCAIRPAILKFENFFGLELLEQRPVCN